MIVDIILWLSDSPPAVTNNIYFSKVMHKHKVKRQVSDNSKRLKTYKGGGGGGGSSKNLRTLMKCSNGNHLRSILHKENCVLKKPVLIDLYCEGVW